MIRNNNDSDHQELVGRLRALAREQQALRAPDRVEERLMAAWDATRTGASRNWFTRPVFQAAAVLVLSASVGYWWVRADREAVQTSPVLEQPASQGAPFETLAWLDPDPGSLYIVRVGVASAVLAAQGYAISDPDGDGQVEIEMIVGPDGVARSARVAGVETILY